MTDSSCLPLKGPNRTPAIAPTAIRYVKLGPKNRWAKVSIDEGRIYFGWPDDPHDLAARSDWPAVHNACLTLGQTPAAATANATEMQAFYELDSKCLWITFADGHLLWGFAEEGVHTLPERLPDGRYHYRRISGGWQRADRLGAPLQIDHLSSSLTQLAAYRRTICKVADEAYLLRVLNAEPNTLSAIARTHLDTLSAALVPLFRQLHWSDFELFVDLLLNREGWRRISRLGGVQADKDILIELPATRERMVVQVKSKIDQAIAGNCAKKLRSLEIAPRRALAFHTVSGSVDTPGLELWDGPMLAQRAVEQGLANWLIERVR